MLETYAGTDGKPVASLLACRLETGRTHQIRVHLAHIGHPLLGDDTYGPGFKTKAALLPENAREALAALGRQALHAHILGFQHPKTRRKPVSFKSAPARTTSARLAEHPCSAGATRAPPGSVARRDTIMHERITARLTAGFAGRNHNAIKAM